MVGGARCSHAITGVDGGAGRSHCACARWRGGGEWPGPRLRLEGRAGPGAPRCYDPLSSRGGDAVCSPRCPLGGEGVRTDGRRRPFTNSPQRAGGAGVASRSHLRVGAFRSGADEAAGQTAAAAGGPGAGSRRCRRQFCAKRMSSESDVAPTRSHVSFLSGYRARCRMHRSITREECDRRRVCAASRAPKTRLLKGRCALWKDARWFSPGTVRETCHLPSCRWPAVESSFLVCFKHRQVRVSQLFGASVLGHRTWPNISC